MARMPRVALGTIQPQADVQPILWALVEACKGEAIHVQSFLSRACFPLYQGATSVAGMTPRHLDSWLMSPAMCQDVFFRGAHAADLTLVLGKYGPSLALEQAGGSLDSLCRWLDLPRVVVLDASSLEPCCLPARPPQVEGVLLDGVTSEAQLSTLAMELEVLWRIPVLGALVRSPPLDAQLEAVRQGGILSQALCRELSARFLEHAHLDDLWHIANQRELPDVKLQQVFPEPRCSKLTLAVAYDEAFHCYFPDTLDWLELRGATVVDFSPLRDESLPANTDLVYLGCGQPERHADALSENHCMKAALRNHFRAGRRIYGEGGGLAYLCEQMETAERSMRRMVGIVPAVARLNCSRRAPIPAEISLTHATWLGAPGDTLRGYRNPLWDLEPLGVNTGFAGQDNRPSAFAGSFQVVGSLVHLNFAAQPEFLRRFFHPLHPSLESTAAAGL